MSHHLVRPKLKLITAVDGMSVTATVMPDGFQRDQVLCASLHWGINDLWASPRVGQPVTLTYPRPGEWIIVAVVTTRDGSQFDASEVVTVREKNRAEWHSIYLFRASLMTP
jgi:hypothetical protein